MTAHMKDQLLLLVTGIVGAVGAWVVFHYGGEYVWPTSLAISVLTLMSKVKKQQKQIAELEAKLENKQNENE